MPSAKCYALVVPLLILTTSCAAIRRAQDRRTVEWLERGITLDQAREMLGTTPYAIPGLEVVAIHADRRTRVVTVAQRLEPGFLISLSQHRGRYIPPASRPFWIVDRYHLERVPYNTGAAPERYYIMVPTGGTASAEERIRHRRLTRWVEEGLSLRIWAGSLGDERQVAMLYEATPITN